MRAAGRDREPIGLVQFGDTLPYCDQMERALSPIKDCPGVFFSGLKVTYIVGERAKTMALTTAAATIVTVMQWG